MGQPVTIMMNGQPVTVDSDLLTGMSFGNSSTTFAPPRERYRTRIRKAKAGSANLPTLEAQQNQNNLASSVYQNWDPTDPGYADAQKIGAGLQAPVAGLLDARDAKDALATAKEEQLASGLTAGLGAAPQVVGGIVGGIQAQQRLNNLQKNGIPDLMPQALKEGMGEAQLAAKSAKVSNYGQQAGQIESNANLATNQVVAGATSPDQVIAGATRVQGLRNRAYNNLSSQGAASQQERKNRLNEFRKIRAQYDDENRRTREQLITDAKNARNQNFLNAGTGVAQGVLLAGM